MDRDQCCQEEQRHQLGQPDQHVQGHRPVKIKYSKIFNEHSIEIL